MIFLLRLRSFEKENFTEIPIPDLSEIKIKNFCFHSIAAVEYFGRVGTCHFFIQFPFEHKMLEILSSVYWLHYCVNSHFGLKPNVKIYCLGKFHINYYM